MFLGGGIIIDIYNIMSSPSRKASPSRNGSPKKLTPEKLSELSLYKAAFEGDNATVEKQIDLGADVDWTYENKFEPTPLIAASIKGHANVVETLILAGADLNKPNKALETPIFQAAKYGNLAIVKMLIFYGADVNKESNMGYTPLHEAAFAEKSQMNNYYIEIIKLLLRRGANINAQNTYGTTPLHAAAVQGKKHMVLILLLNGADIKIKNQYNKLAGEMARENNFPDIAEMIEKWPTLYALAALDDNYSLNSIDMQNIEDMYRLMGGKRKTRGKRILGRKTRSNRRRRNYIIED